MLDLIVLGGGPAGYLGAERAARAGLKVELIEKNALGGVCLNEGCIPSKALLHSAKVYETALHAGEYGVEVGGVALNHRQVVDRRARVIKRLVAGVGAALKGAGVDVIKGEGVIQGRAAGGFLVGAEGRVHQAKRLLVATGSSPIVPPIPGLKEALESGFVVTNREILKLDRVPKELVIVGGGVIGLEMAAYYRTAGSKVTVVEMLPGIAGPTDWEISGMLLKEYQKKGVFFQLNAKVTGFSFIDGNIEVEREGEKLTLHADKVLLSVSRKANTAGLGLEAIGVEMDRLGIVIDEQCRTNVENIYAAGDVTGRWMLAHTAYREAEVAVNTMLGIKDRMRYHANPSVIYTKPEVASVGLTEEGAKEANIPYEAKKVSAMYSGRFLAENQGEDGLCKVLIHKEHRNIIGVHMIGPYSSEIIWGAAAMIEMELRVTDAREIIFPHPTVSELIREALWMFED